MQGGALGITHNNANGSSKTEVAMMDMNGDGFPDIIAGGTIQYTNSQGGLSGEIYKGIGANNSDNASEAWGYGGNPVASVSQITNLAKGVKQSLSNSQRMNHPRRKRRNAEEALAFDESYKPFKQQKKNERRTIGSHLRHS